MKHFYSRAEASAGQGWLSEGTVTLLAIHTCPLCGHMSAAGFCRHTAVSILAGAWRLTFLSVHSQAEQDTKQLEALIVDHDAIFLLMDTRESRWLPSLLGAAANKIDLQDGHLRLGWPN